MADLLPLSIPTLDHLPHRYHPQYERAFDGSFRLAFIRQDDTDNWIGHLDAIAAGKLSVIPAGASPSAADAYAAERASMSEATAAEVKRLEDVDAAQRRARLAADQEAARAKLERALAQAPGASPASARQAAQLAEIERMISRNDGTPS